jgi:hypothetical protein
VRSLGQRGGGAPPVSDHADNHRINIEEVHHRVHLLTIYVADLDQTGRFYAQRGDLETDIQVLGKRVWFEV